MSSDNQDQQGWSNLSYPALCACLKTAMRDAGLIPKDLSKRSGKRYATVVELLNGKIPNPQLDTIDAVCEALGLRLSFELRPDTRKKPGRRPGSTPVDGKEKSPGE